MARYIDAEKIRIELERLTLINNLTQRQDDVTEEYKCVHKGMTSAYNHCRNIILDAPTADVVEVKHGEWRKPLGDDGSGWNCGGVVKQILGCSCCGHFYQNAPYNYCPNCGAKMDGEDVTDNAD